LEETMMVVPALCTSRSVKALAALVLSVVVVGCAPAPTAIPEAQIDEAGEATPQSMKDEEIELCDPDHVVRMMDHGGTEIVDPCTLKVFTADCVKFRNETELEATFDVPQGLFNPEPDKVGPGDSVSVVVVKEVEIIESVSYQVQSETGPFGCWDPDEATPRIIVRPPPQSEDSDG
jgi:hypothetical protein